MKEYEIRPADVFGEYLRLSANDVAHFFADPSRRCGRPCPGCAAHGPGQFEFEKNGFTLVRCLSCGSLYVDPVPVESDLDAFYADSPSQQYWANVFFPSVAEARREKIFRMRVAKLAEMLKAETLRRVIDVGAGRGLFLEECRSLKLGEEWWAVEPNRDMAATCRGSGFPTFQGFSGQAAVDPVWAGSADLVTSFEVLEHVTDPSAFLVSLAALLRPGGLMMVTGVCGDGFDIRVLRQRSNTVSPPHHLNFLSRRGVSALLARSGLEEVSLTTPGKLDVDIVRNMLSGESDIVVDDFLKMMLTESDQSVLDDFQNLLARHGMSSHMWIIARKAMPEICR